MLTKADFSKEAALTHIFWCAFIFKNSPSSHYFWFRLRSVLKCNERIPVIANQTEWKLSVSKMHSGSANVEVATKETVTPGFALAKCFFPFPHFCCIITRHGAGWVAWAGCDDIEDLWWPGCIHTEICLFICPLWKAVIHWDLVLLHIVLHSWKHESMITITIS